jgi:hypothetical protein
MTQHDQVQSPSLPPGMLAAPALLATGLRLRLTRELSFGPVATLMALSSGAGDELPISSIPAIV